MSNRQQSASTPVPQFAQWRGCGRRAGLLLALGAVFALPVHAQDADSSEEWALDASQSSKGHGSMSIGYQDTLVNGFKKHRGGTRDVGTVRIHALDLDVEYFFADRWSVRAGVPFVQSRYHGGFPHCPTRNPVPCQNPDVRVPDPEHPESRFLDDGDAHGTWQDWLLSVSYHTNIDNYYLTPSVTVLVPSHDYTFFAQSAVGQDLNKLRVGIELAHQFDFTELYYKVDVAHVFAEETLGVSIDSNRLDLELGYFVSPKLTLKTFAFYKRGDGIFNDDPRLSSSEFFYHHDQISKHEYFNVGLGLDYNIDDKTTLSTTAQTLIWGETVYNLRYSIDVRLTRDF